jgi:hypothetical protein
MRYVVAVALGVLLGLLVFVGIVAILNCCGCCGLNANGTRGGVLDVLARLLLPPPLRRLLSIPAYDRVLSASSSHRGSDDDMGMDLGTGHHQLDEEEREFKRIIEMRGEEMGRALFNDNTGGFDVEEGLEGGAGADEADNFDSRDRDRLSMLETYRSHLLSSATTASSSGSGGEGGVSISKPSIGASAAAQAAGLNESALRL